MKVPWAKTEVSEIQEYCEREKKKREIKNGDINPAEPLGNGPFFLNLIILRIFPAFHCTYLV